MALLEIKKAGDPVLKQQAVLVENIDRKIKKMLDDMAETMYHADGVGLAAPQIGIPLQVVVIDVGNGLIELINPVIKKQYGVQEGQEGCLSFPGMFGDVDRYEEVTVEALDRRGKKISLKAHGFLARAVQHEVDHLSGVLFIERAKSVYKG